MGNYWNYIILTHILIFLINIKKKEVKKMKKNRVKVFLLFLFMVIVTNCSTVPRISNYFLYKLYGVMENGKINRMGLSKENYYTMIENIRRKYHIVISNKADYIEIFSNEDLENYNYIKFYNNPKIIVNGKEYTLDKEQIRINRIDSSINYELNPIPDEIADIKYDTYILNVGEIEITTQDKKVVLPRTKIPPLVFKKVYSKVLYKDMFGIDQEELYRGWAEYYKGD